MDVAKGLLGFLEDRATILGHQMLWEIGYRDPFGYGDLAPCGLTATAKDLEQGTLASTILAHEGYAILRVNDKGDIREEGGTPDLYGKGIDRNHRSLIFAWI